MGISEDRRSMRKAATAATMNITTLDELLGAVEHRIPAGDGELIDFLFEVSTIEKAAKIKLDTIDWLQIKKALKNSKQSIFSDFKKAVLVRKKVDARTRDAIEGMSGRYKETDGCIYYVPESLDTPQKICNFAAEITEVLEREIGGDVYRIDGTCVVGGKFSLEIEADKFDDDRRLRSILSSAAGPHAVIEWRMASHLAPAIKSLTGPVTTIKLYERTGWTNDNEFLIPGMEPDDTLIKTSLKTDFNVVETDLGKALEALEGLIKSIGTEYTLPVLCGLFYAQIARFTGDVTDRPCIFIAGETGSFKTSWALAAMRIFCHEFDKRNGYAKWGGAGETIKSLIEHAGFATDMPLLVDNYKPNIAPGITALITLIHGIVEGGTRGRLSRAGKLLPTKPIGATLLCTGEDFPMSDKATVARTVLVEFPKDTESRGRNKYLDVARDGVKHLSTIFYLWIKWLMSKDGEARIREVWEASQGMDEYWEDKLIEIAESTTPNFKRIGTNLMRLSYTFKCLCSHPDFGQLFSEHEDEFDAGLVAVCSNLSLGSMEADEGDRFLEHLKTLLDTGRAILVNGNVPMTKLGPDDRRRAVGWDKGSLGIGIKLSIVRQLIYRELNDNLGGMTNNRIYKKMELAGWLVKQREGTRSYSINTGGRTVSVMMLKREAIE